LSDGRHIGFSVIGEGTPIIYFHSTASSRLETLLLKEFACDNGFKLIGVDRPGYGLSTYTPRNNLRDFSKDVNCLMDHLELDLFALIAWSGGGPFGLTYIALYPERVTKAVIIGSPSLPFDVATAHNNSLARPVMQIPALGIWGLKRFRAEVLKANKDISAFLESKKGKKMLESWPDADAKFFANPHWLTLMYDSIAEGFHQKSEGVKAVFEEHQLFTKPWVEPISLIPYDKVFLWHGTEDTTCRVENVYQLKDAIPTAILDIFHGKGHCVMFDNLQKLGESIKLA
jgi:pimeloyl-ACP methyl ester carboxylesterase